MASSEQLKLVIDVVNKNALKGMGDLKKAAKGVGDELDDTRTAAKRVAAELEKRADEMASDLKSSEKAAEALANALGPEMAAKIGDARLDSFIGDLKRAGLSFEEVEADAESFAQALRKMDAAADSVKNVDAATARLGDTADNSRNVLANMVGNSVQDLGELGGVAGTAGVAIGQLAEYAADGNISLAGFAKVAGPMAALGVGVAGVSKLISLLTEESRELAKETKVLVQVQEDLADQKYAEAAQELEKEYGGLIRTFQKYGFTTEEVVAAMKGELDLRPRLNDLIKENTGVTGENAAEAEAARVQLTDMIAKLDMAETAYGDAAEQIANTATTTASLEAALRGANPELQTAGDYAEYYRSRAEAATEQGEYFAGSADRQRDAFRAATEKVRDMRDAVEELYGIERDAIQRQDDLTDSLEDLNTVLGDSKASTEAQYDAAISASEAYATLNGATLNSRDGTLRQIESLQGLASSLDPKSPLRAALEKYIAQLAAIPDRIDTMLALNITQGATTTKSGDIIGVRDIPGKVVHKASGGQVRAGVPTIVGEQGEEMFVPNTNGVVVPHGMTQQMMQGGGRGAGVTNITIQVMSADPKAVVEAVKRYTRSGGVL